MGTQIKKEKGIYLDINETINAIDFLEKANYFIQKSYKNKIDWKWATLSLHGALYGFSICALRGSNYHNVLQKDKKTKRQMRLKNQKNFFHL